MPRIFQEGAGTAPSYTVATLPPIATVLEGIPVYTTDGGWYYSNGSAWVAMGGGGGGSIDPTQANLPSTVTTTQALADYVGSEAPWVPAGLAGNGTTDDTAAIQAALSTDAPVVLLPPNREYLVTSSLTIRENQTLIGAPTSTYIGSASPQLSAVLKFRPAAPDTALINEAGKAGQCVQNLVFDIRDGLSFGVGFESSYANKILYCSFRGEMGVGVYLDDTYVCEVFTPDFVGSKVANYCVYLGDTHGCHVMDFHGSTIGTTASIAAGVPSVGVGVYGGYGQRITKPVLQGHDIGIALRATTGVVIDAAYIENVLCTLKVGDLATSNAATGTEWIGGTIFGPSAAHPNYSKRGPLIYGSCFDGLALRGTRFVTTNSQDAALAPVLLNYGGDFAADTPTYAQSQFRNEVFKKSASPKIVGINIAFGNSFGQREWIMKTGDDFSTHMGLRISSAGVISATTWTPTEFSPTVNALLSSAFVVPVRP